MVEDKNWDLHRGALPLLHRRLGPVSYLKNNTPQNKLNQKTGNMLSVFLFLCGGGSGCGGEMDRSYWVLPDWVW